MFPLILFTTKKHYFSITILLNSFLAGFMVVACFSVGEILFTILSKSEPLSLLITHYTRWNFTNTTSLSYHTPYMGVHAVLCFTIILFNFNPSRPTSYILKSTALAFLVLVIYILGTKLPIILLALVSTYYLFYFALSKRVPFAKINLLFVFFIFIFGTLLFLNQDFLLKKLSNNIKTQDLYWGSLPNRTIKFLKSGDIDRKENWYSAYYAFLESPVIGVGVGDALEQLQDYRNPNTWNYKSKANTHNQFLDIAVKLGVIGLFVFSLSFFCSIKIALIYDSKIYLIFLVIFILALLVENVLDRQKGIILFTFLNSIFLCRYVLYDKFITKENRN